MGRNERGKNRVKIGKQIFAIVLVLSMLSLAGCGSLEEAIAQAKNLVPADWKIVHTEQVQDQAAVVFYVRNKELGAGIFEKDAFGWNWLGSGLGTLVTYPEGLAWRYTDLGNKNKKQYYLFYGIVTNPAITQIEVKTTSGEIAQAKIIDTDNMKLWYAFVNQPQIPSVDADITGYSKNGEVLYLFSQPKQGSK